MAAKMAMIATTIINSIRVKPVTYFVEGMGEDSWRSVPSAEHNPYHTRSRQGHGRLNVSYVTHFVRDGRGLILVVRLR
jgi:hypothetical protein